MRRKQDYMNMSDTIRVGPSGRAAILILIVAILCNPSDATSADKSPFQGEKTAWRGGFDRYDFVMDEETLAIEHPDSVSCIYGENPALRSLMAKSPPLDNLAALARAGVPLIHVCGSLDPWLDSQTRVVEKRYKSLGGKITVIIKDGEGHYPLAPQDPKAIADLIDAGV